MGTTETTISAVECMIVRHCDRNDFVYNFMNNILFLDGDGLPKEQRMGTSPFHSPKVSAHKKLSAVV